MDVAGIALASRTWFSPSAAIRRYFRPAHYASRECAVLSGLFFRPLHVLLYGVDSLFWDYFYVFQAAAAHADANDRNHQYDGADDQRGQPGVDNGGESVNAGEQ